jgi:hypothetical protein
MSKMNVLSFAKTGHILGVVTRNSQQDKAMTVQEAAGSGLYVLASGAAKLTSVIATDALTISQIDYDTRVIYRPCLFRIAGSDIEQQGVGLPSVTLNGVNLTLTLPAAVTGDTEVWAYITAAGLDAAISRSVKILDGTTSASEALQLAAGTYTVLILAPGYAARIVNENVP